jgi:hypothetical protein
MEVDMISIAAKPSSKAEMIRIAKANDSTLTEDQLIAQLGVSRTQVQQALASKGVPMRRGLRS